MKAVVIAERPRADRNLITELSLNETQTRISLQAMVKGMHGAPVRPVRIGIGRISSLGRCKNGFLHEASAFKDVVPYASLRATPRTLNLTPDQASAHT